jgi:predicted thioesterase
MIAFMERVSHRLLAEHLSPGETSVGIYLEIEHLAPTPVGSTVRVLTQVADIDGNQVTFNVETWDHIEKVGQGVHRRAIIDEARFLRRVKSKQ